MMSEEELKKTGENIVELFRSVCLIKRNKLEYHYIYKQKHNIILLSKFVE